MDADNYFPRTLEETSSFNLENFFYDQNWSSLMATSITGYNRNTLMLEPENYNIKSDTSSLSSFQNVFSQRVHSRLDEYYQRKSLLFSKVMHSQDNMRNVTYNLSYLKNKHLEETAFTSFLDTSLPGLNPLSSWPVCLDELIERINKLEIYSLFTQPFDMQLNFYNQSKQYIENALSSKSLIQYLPKAIAAFICVTLLKSDTMLIHDMFVFLKLMESKYQNEFSNCFKLSYCTYQHVLNKLQMYYHSLPIQYPLLLKYELTETYAISSCNLFSPSKYFFNQSSSVTCDGSYLYLILSGLSANMLKVGTGYNGTTKGKVYLSKTVEEENLYQWVYLNGRLYCKCGNSEDINVYDVETFTKVGKVKLLFPENVKHSALKKKFDNYVLLANESKLLVIAVEPVINQNTKHSLPNNLNPNFDDDDDSDQQYSVIYNNNNNTQENLYDTFTHVNVIMLTYNVDNTFDKYKTVDATNTNKINSTLSLEKQNLIKELYESFSYYFSYENCHRVLAMFDWNFEKAAMYLIDNGENIKEDMLISETKEILYSCELEGTQYKNSIIDFVPINNTSSTAFPINSFNNLKWIYTGNNCIIAYKFADGECFVFKDNKYISSYNAIQISRNDYLLTYDREHCNYYLIANYAYTSQSVIVANLRNEAIQHVEQKIKSDLKLKEIDFGKDYTNDECNIPFKCVNELYEYIEGMFILFGLRKNLCEWKYKNWNYFYTTYFDQTVVNRKMIDIGIKQMNTRLKGLTNKIDKFREINEKELFRQLNNEFPNSVNDYDLDLDGKNRKQTQSYESVPKREKVNWCSWDYIANFLFEKKKEDKDVVATTTTTTTTTNVNDNNKVSSPSNSGNNNNNTGVYNDTIEPKTKIKYLYLENKIETFFTYNGNENTYTYLISEYTNAKDSSNLTEKFIISYLYKILCYIETIDTSLLFKSINKDNSTEPTSSLSELENILHSIYTSNSLGTSTTKPIIEAIVLLGWEFLAQTLSLQIKWFSLFYKSSLSSPTPSTASLSLISNTSPITNIYNIISTNSSSLSFYVLIDLITRLYKGSTYPISLGKVNNMKIYALTLYDNKIYGNTTNRGIKPSVFQTPFYYVLLDNQHLFTLREKHWRQTMFTIFKKDDKDNQRHKSRLGMLFSFAKMHSDKESYPLDSMFQISQFTNVFHHKREMFNGENVKTFKEIIIDSINVNNKDEVSEVFDKIKLMFYIQMEFNITCELSEIVQLANEYKFNNLLLISNKHLRTHLFNEHGYDEDDETMIMFDEIHHHEPNNTNTNTSANNTEQSKQQASTTSTVNDFISFIFDHITNQQLIPAFMKYPHLYTLKNYLLFNALPQELISLTINDLIAVQSKMQNILSLSKQIHSSSYEVLSSQGFQIENEKVFEFTLTQGENFKCNETVQFPSALAIVVEFEIKTASSDIKPHFDLTLISKEHPYNNTNNNNYANLGTQFLIKLDSNDFTTTKYILKGNEMKLLTQPESSYRSRSQYKNNASTNKHSKIYIKIKCYPYSNSDYAIINPCTNTLTQINNEHNKLELMFYDMVNYYITLISKFLIRSVTITENESSLYKDKNILFLSKYGLANTALSLDAVFNNSVTALDTGNIKVTTCSIVNLIKDVHCGNVSEYIKQIKTIITHLDNNNLSEAETLFKSLNLIRKHIRDIVPEPRNYITLKMLPSFNAVNKMYWNVCEMLFMICLFYHLNVISDVDKIKDEDYEPGYIEYIGKKMNKLILYLTGRVQYMKETYDNLKHYCEIIVDMFNECIGNIKKMVVDKITIDYYSNNGNNNKDVEKGKEDKKDNDNKKDKDDDKDKGDNKGKGNKIKKGKMQIEELEKKFGSKGKNYKKKANVSRLYVELPKKKKKGVNKKTTLDNNKPDNDSNNNNNKDDKDNNKDNNDNNNKDPKKKNENDLPFEVISTLSLDELFENFPQYKPEYFNNDIIQSLNSEILEKIDNDFRIAYYGNKEKIKAICEVYSIPFSESNINQSLREYSKVLQNKLVKIYSFPTNPPCKEITLDTLLPKVETESPYKNVILPIIDKLLLILEFKNNPHIQIKENELELSKKELSLTFTKSKISESTNLYINDIDASTLNIPIQAQRIVQKIFGIIQQNKVDIENTKFALYVKYIRNIIRNRGLELLCEFYTSNTYFDLFTNTYGLISSGLTQSGSNAIMLNNEMTYILLEHNVKCIHHQLGLFNSEIMGMTITKNDYLCTVLKNLNLLLNDVNVILSNTLYYMQLEKNYTTTKESALLNMKDIITKALGIMINDKVKNNVKIMKGISEFVLNFRNFLSKLVRVGIVVNNNNSITALIIDSLLEALDKVIDFDNNISLISSLLDIIYHIMISIDTNNNTSTNNEQQQQQQSQTTLSFIDSFSKGLAKLLSLILNSTTPHLVNLSVKIAKLFLKNGQITNETFINLFAKIGQLSHMETLSSCSTVNASVNAVDDSKRYNIIIEMNSPEIDYEFLVNALYQWEEWYPTSLSSYKKGIVVSKDNEINVVIPPGKEIKHFIPLKKKVTKTAHLENIVNKKITELNKRLTELSELLKQSKQDNNTNSKEDTTNNKDDKSNKKKKKNKDNSDGDNSNKEPKKQLTLKEAQDCLNEVDLIQIKSQYLIRLLSHIKLCYKIGECASTRGYVILDNKYPKQIAEKFTKLIMTSFYDLSPSIPSETALNIDGTINIEKNTTPFFSSNDIHPPLYTMDELLPGCTNILKEITKPYLNCLLIESSTIYPKLFKSISLSSSKTTQDASIRSSTSNYNNNNNNSQQQQRNQQGNVPSSSLSSENTQHIVDCRFISGESITCIMDYIIDLIQHALNDHDKYKNVYESVIKTILEGKEKGKEELLGLFIYVSGGVNVIRQGSKCYCNDGSCVTVVNGGYESGMKTANVVFNNENNINNKEHKSNTTSTRVLSNVEYKIEKVNAEQLSKGYIDSKVLKLIDINYLIELFINLYTTNTNTNNSCSSSSSSHKISFTHNIMLYILKLLSIVIHTPIDSMSLVSCDTFNKFYSIIKTINNDINWIHLTKTVLDHNLLMSFERRLTATNELNYQIYAPLCIDIPLKQSSHQPQSNQQDSIDMITNYTLPESTFVSQLPQIEDTSKSCLALKNIAQFERYTVEEVFNYAKSHYRDHEYLFYLRQVRQELSFNDIQNAKNDIYVIFDQSKVPPGMPLPLEHRDMKEIFKEECYPNNYYLAKMSHKLIRETGINSLLTVNNSNSKIISNTSSSSTTTHPIDVDNNSTDNNTQQQEHNNNDITSDNNIIQNTTSNLKEIPVLVLLVDNLIHQAFVMYNDYTYCNIHTFWIPLSNLSLLDFNMKLPPQSLTQEQLDNEYNHAYEQLFNYYTRCIMCSIYEKQIEAYKLNDLDDMTKFINLALWLDNIKDPLDGVLKKVKNYIQVKKKETNLDLNVKRFSSSRIDMVSPSNSNVYQPKFDINKVLTHINKKNPLSLLTSNTNTQSHLQCGDNNNEYDDTYMTPLSKIEIELNDNNEHFSLKNITSLCIDKIKSFSSNLLQIRFADLYNEYKQEISSPLFTITTMGTKLLSLHSLCNITNPNDYCACIISFEESGILGPNAKLTFYSDNTSQHVLKEVSSSKASRSSIESVLLLQSEIYMEYTEGTTAFYINDWDTQPRYSTLPCYITYIPYEWLLIEWLTDYCSSAVFDQGSYSTNDKLSVFQQVIKELLVLCTSLKIPAELQQNIFAITNRVLLKAIKFISIEKCVVDRKAMSISEKFDLIGFDEVSFIGIIKNVDGCLKNKQTKNFSSSYIVDQVEIVLAILSFVQESYLTLELYLKEVFDYSLPLWVEAIIKLGNFLSFLQGNSSGLEENLMKEIKDIVDISKDTSLIERNIFVIKDINYNKQQQVVQQQPLQTQTQQVKDVIEDESKILVTPIKEYDFIMDWATKKIEDELSEEKSNDKANDNVNDKDKVTDTVNDKANEQHNEDTNEDKEKIIKDKIIEIAKKMKCKIVNTNTDIQLLNNCTCAIILSDGFEVDELKELPDEDDKAETTKKKEEEENKEQFWVCSCGFDNAMENEFCCACDKEKPELLPNIPQANSKTKKQTLIKTEAYTLKVEDLSQEFIHALETEPLFHKSTNTNTNTNTTSYKVYNLSKMENNLKQQTLPLINKFLLKRLYELLLDDNYCNEYLSHLLKDKDNIISILKHQIKEQHNEQQHKELLNYLLQLNNNNEYDNDINNKLKSFDYFTYYTELQVNECIDIYHTNLKLQNETLMKSINLHLLERIRELIDVTLCKESKITYVYQTSSIRFIPETFPHTNHTPITILHNYYKDLVDISLINIRYYWAIIRYFNNCLISALPFIKPPDVYSQTTFNIKEDKDYLYIPFPKTISMFLSSFKGITFSVTKYNLINDVLSCTEFSAEEVQIPTFKFERLVIADKKQENANSNSSLVNNIQSNSNIISNESNITLNERESLFLQAYEQGKDIDVAFYRSSKIPGDPHMGFKIEFKGELVQGLGGPYRQFFSDISNELIPSDKENRKLNLFCPTSNNKAQTGDYKDKYTITPSYNSNTQLNHYEFLGMLMGVCLRTSVYIPLDLCTMIWKKLTDTPITVDDIKEFDEGIIEQVNFLSEIDTDNFDGYNLTYCCELSDGTLYDLIPNGKYEKVLYEDRAKYMELFLKARLTEMDKQVAYIKKGLFKLIPPSLIKLLTNKELEAFVSGSLNKDVDIALLKSFTKYSNDLNEESKVIKWLWEIIEEMTVLERRKFIKFCWAQEKLPSTKDQYERLQVIFTIKSNSNKNRKDVFPKADTCFFALELPDYTSKEVMKSKIISAINLDNVSINADKINNDHYESRDMNIQDDDSYEY